MSQKKYEITEITHPKYPWLHRIRARCQVNEQPGQPSDQHRAGKQV